MNSPSARTFIHEIFKISRRDHCVRKMLYRSKETFLTLREMFIAKIGRGGRRNLHVIGSIRVGIGSFGEIKPFVREGFLVLLISCAKARIRCQATVRRVPSCPHRRGFSWFTHLGEVTSLREKDMEEIWRERNRVERRITSLSLFAKRK